MSQTISRYMPRTIVTVPDSRATTASASKSAFLSTSEHCNFHQVEAVLNMDSRGAPTPTTHRNQPRSRAFLCPHSPCILPDQGGRCYLRCSQKHLLSCELSDSEPDTATPARRPGRGRCHRNHRKRRPSNDQKAVRSRDMRPMQARCFYRR